MGLMGATSALASSLCARVVIGSPKQLLATDHNADNYDLTGVKWSRYFNIVDTIHLTDVLEMPTDPLMDDYNRVRLGPVNTSDKLLEAFEDAYRLTENQTALFELRIRVRRASYWVQALDDYINAHHRFAEGMPDFAQPWPNGPFARRCAYTKTVYSSEVLGAAARTLTSLGGPTFGARNISVLHIRRGDTKEMCNTTVPDVIEYMTCASSTAPWKQDDKLIVLSDETDPQYLDDVMQRLNAMPRFRGRAVFGETLIQEHVQFSQVNETTGQIKYDSAFNYAVGRVFIEIAVQSYSMWWQTCIDGRAPCEVALPVNYD